MYVPSEEEFHRLAGRGNIIPVYREVLADMDTPVSAFLKIQEGRNRRLHCGHCRKAVVPEARFCNACGHSLMPDPGGPGPA